MGILFEKKIGIGPITLGKATGIFDIWARAFETRLSKKDHVMEYNFKKLGLFWCKTSKFGACSGFLEVKDRPWSLAHIRITDSRKSPPPPPPVLWRPKIRNLTAQNWKRVRNFHFLASPKLEAAAVSTFGFDPKLEAQLPDPEVETSLTVW